MASTQNDTKEDPLIAALPPATDYLTYLTLLEYQLKPDNLSTLNKLLSEDDGTLAAEIGWDLLKLVLPMLQIVPEDASICLGIIARRGNPREVVVRVAEELERLGRRENELSEDGEDDLDQDGLPTFAGEAPPIHLGDMKLDGMPETNEHGSDDHFVEPARNNRQASISAESGSDDNLILKALLSMLGVLHPRIKTQYPSRFLATSLPAALEAYRSINVTSETTLAFTTFLAKLSGKQRPALPPRVSTAASIPTTAIPIATTGNTSVQAPPLPDPEAKTDKTSSNKGSEVNEKAITERLLQAVMLEVLDEYTSSFHSTNQPSMSWTFRLREKHEPKRVLPNRPTENQRWSQSADLKSRDEVLARFLKLAKDLNLNVTAEIDKLVNPPPPRDERSDLEQTESDYPTSPSQIPFPSSGLILLFAAQNFAQDTIGLSDQSPVSLATIRTIFRTTFAPTQDLPHPPSLSQTDALLSLIYTSLQSPLTQQTPSQTYTTAPGQAQSTSSHIDLPFLTNLTGLFTTSPDPFIRDSTHHITSLLLHNHTSSEIRLLYLKSLLTPSLTPASPIHEVQQGNTRALALNWLKDEFVSYANTTPTNTETNTDVRGLDPTLLTTDPDLPTLIFPLLPTPPSQFISSHPQPPSSSLSESSLELFLLHLPSHIASLNLLCILSSLSLHPPSSSSSSSSPPLSLFDPRSPLTTHATPFYTSLAAWSTILLGLAGGIARKPVGASDGPQGPVDVTDVYALEDAVGRARGIVEGWADEE